MKCLWKKVLEWFEKIKQCFSMVWLLLVFAVMEYFAGGGGKI